MKKFIPVVLAVIIGCTFAFLVFKKFESSTLSEIEGNAVGVQIGVFTKKENAQSLKEKLGGIVLEDDGLYRVFYSVLSDKSNIDYITSYLSNEKINYYLKKLTLDDATLSEMNEYEELMKKTKDKAKITVNEKLIKKFGEVI